MDPQLLADMRDHLTLISNQGGVCTVRFAISICKHPRFSQLSGASGQSLRGVNGFKINMLKQNVAIRYDANIIAPAMWDTLFTAQEGPELDSAVSALRAVIG